MDESEADAIADDASLEAGLLASAHLAVLRLDERGAAVACSPAAQALLGHACGTTGPDVGLVAGEHRVRTADGRLLDVDLHPAPGGSGWLGVVTATDVVAALAATEQELRARFDDSPLPQARVGLDGRMLAVNAAFESLLGYSQDLLRGRDAVGMFGEADQESVAAALQRLTEGTSSARELQERTVERADGTLVRVAVTADVVRDQRGEPVLVCSVQDLTPLRTAERAVSAGEARLRALLRHATDVVVVVDARGCMSYVSPAVSERFGYDEEQLHLTRALDLNHPDDIPMIVGVFERVQRVPAAVEVFECRVRHADGSWRWTEQSYTNLLEDPDVAGVVINLRETTERRRAEQDLRQLAVRDSLTGLANRTLLLDRVEQALQRSRRSGERAGLVLLDVVGMREHNERLGHDGGDALLLVLAERLQSAAGPTASVARVGQDEFGVLVEDVTSTEALRTRAAALLSAAQEPLRLHDAEVVVALRAGFALTPADSAGGLLAAAERVVRRRDGGTGPAVSQGTVEACPAHAELAEAVAQGQLRLHFQPVLRLGDGGVEGVEALVRWQHPTRGLLGPADFVPLAETSGLVVELGEWVLRAACTAVAAWTAAGRTLSVGVNLSPRQLAVPGFGDVLRRVLAETGVRPCSLVLEVTESALMDDDGALETLRGLHSLGVRLALDDFGTGYSSLTYLKRFPVDALKIDRSFVAGLGRDRDDEAIVASIVSLARSVGKTVVAEGVETAAQLRTLQQLGVQQAQGFLWAKALPVEQLECWLDAFSPTQARHGSHLAVPSDGLDREQVSGVERRILSLQADGASLQTIASALNAEGLRSPSGARWHSRSVARVVAALVRAV